MRFVEQDRRYQGSLNFFTVHGMVRVSHKIYLAFDASIS